MSLAPVGERNNGAYRRWPPTAEPALRPTAPNNESTGTGCRDHCDERRHWFQSATTALVKVCHPQLIGTTRLESTLHQMERSLSTFIGDCCAAFTTAYAPS